MILPYILDKSSTPNGLTPNTIKRRRVTVGRTKESLRQMANMKSSVDIKTDKDSDLVLSNTEIDFVYEGSPLPDRKPDQTCDGAKEQNETINLETSAFVTYFKSAMIGNFGSPGNKSVYPLKAATLLFIHLFRKLCPNFVINMMEMSPIYSSSFGL